MQIGFNAPTSGVLIEPDSLTRIITEGEALGFDYTTVSDHIMVPRNLQSKYPYTGTGEFPAGAATDHRRAPFRGYGALPAGAQSALRTAMKNRTAGYGRPGVKIAFADPTSRCNVCSLCVVQCPEGIIQFTPDPARGPIVHGAKFDDYCKGCRECVVACPLDLFSELSIVAPPEGAHPTA